MLGHGSRQMVLIPPTRILDFRLPKTQVMFGQIWHIATTLTCNIARPDSKNYHDSNQAAEVFGFPIRNFEF